MKLPAPAVGSGDNMEDFESIALGLRATPAKATLDASQHVRLSNPELQIVSGFPNSSQYNITLKILEGEIEKLETEHLKHYKNREEFDRTGLIAVAARLLYEKYQHEVNYHSEQYASKIEESIIDEEVKNMTPEEIIRRSFGL